MNSKASGGEEITLDPIPAEQTRSQGRNCAIADRQQTTDRRGTRRGNPIHVTRRYRTETSNLPYRLISQIHGHDVKN